MEQQTSWTSKLAPSAQVASPRYQVLIHNTPLSFQQENAVRLKELQKENQLYIPGMQILKAFWLKNNKQPGNVVGSLILDIGQAEHADQAISKGILWKYEIEATEIFRSSAKCRHEGHTDVEYYTVQRQQKQEQSTASFSSGPRPIKASCSRSTIAMSSSNRKNFSYTPRLPSNISSRTQSKELETLKYLPELLSKEGHHILVGDFNLHHPRWGGQTVFSHHKLAEDLVEQLGSREMELALPERTITWNNRGSEGTFDIVFLSKELEDSVISRQPDSELEASSDHIPISTQLSIQPNISEEPEPRPRWKKADSNEVNKRFSAKLLDLRAEYIPLNNRRAIDQRVVTITKAIQKTVEGTIPKAKPSRFAKSYWNAQCSEAVKDTRKARRKWKKLSTEESWIEYQKTTSKKKAQIKRAKTIGWRAAVSEASHDPTKIWKLAKWAKKDPEEKQRPSQVPDIKDTDGVIHTDAADRAIIVAEHFFPQPAVADSAGTSYPEEKPQKPRYDTPKSYRPIALLNTIGKLLEKLVANRICKAAEEFNLLPEEQMGARPKRSMISAIELLTKQIHTIWGKDKKQVASLLSLDISGAFDNVSHERLVHNLREK
ncbi:hypothetical protein K3495_g4497 [Podosphaera aphanis]|nr:hypothetical protein K3495_g4497 [Podosphaera aphanis]